MVMNDPRLLNVNWPSYFKSKLYKVCLVYPSNSIHGKYGGYKNILRKCSKEAEINHYGESFNNHKIVVCNPWKSFNPTIKPKRGKSFTPANKY